MTRKVPLETAAEEVCNQSTIPPLIFDLPPEQARQRLEDAQSIPVYMYPAKYPSEILIHGIGARYLFILFHPIITQEQIT